MVSIRHAATLFGAFMLAASPAVAATVTNQNKKEHILTVDRGEQETDHKIAPGASLQIDCKEGCALRLKNGAAGYDSMVADGDKLLINEKGFLTHDQALTTGAIEKVQDSSANLKELSIKYK